MLYLSEAAPLVAEAVEEHPLVRAVTEDRIMIDVPARPFSGVIRDLLEPEFGDDADRWDEIAERLNRKLEDATARIRPDVVVPHLRIEGLATPMLFVVTSREGIEFPRLDEPAHVVFVLLTPAGETGEHLRHLAAIAHLVGDRERVRAIILAESAKELRDTLSAHVGSEELLV